MQSVRENIWLSVVGISDFIGDWYLFPFVVRNEITSKQVSYSFPSIFFILEAVPLYKIGFLPTLTYLCRWWSSTLPSMTLCMTHSSFGWYSFRVFFCFVVMWQWTFALLSCSLTLSKHFLAGSGPMIMLSLDVFSGDLNKSGWLVNSAGGYPRFTSTVLSMSKASLMIRDVGKRTTRMWETRSTELSGH